ncbi:MAG: hypothetical protein U1E56_13775 [Bauldia sp.]
MAQIIKPSAYANSIAITMGLASLASTTADPPAGRESNEVDNSSNLYEDAHVYAEIKGGTTPTVNTVGNLYAWAADYDGTTVKRPAGITGADANLTPTSAGAHLTHFGLLWSFIFNATTGTVYKRGGLSVCRALGLLHLPIRWGLFFHHNSVAALDATAGNHIIRYTPVNRQITP